MTSLSALTVPAPGTTGAVWLVGAGPGDAELLTLKALRAIEQATVVVDRLVSDEVLALIPSTTPCIDAGKAPGRHGMKQQDINRLLVDLACAGHRVVRLKGGDPFIFGRGGEEMLALQRAGISCRVVPGITAAAGCAASTGIPLTHRECAQSVQFITGHGKNGAPALDWDALRDPRQTLVFYMGLTWCAELSRGLMDNGRAAAYPGGDYRKRYPCRAAGAVNHAGGVGADRGAGKTRVAQPAGGGGSGQSLPIGHCFPTPWA